jgi:hypothetical protein
VLPERKIPERKANIDGVASLKETTVSCRIGRLELSDKRLKQ